MRFTFEGKNYSLSFTRKHQHVTFFHKGNRHTTPSTYPFTTATLYVSVGASVPTVLASATVGCSHLDAYSNSKGRLYAMKELNKRLIRYNLPEEFRRAMWNAYMNRGKSSLVIDTVATKVEEVRALPPAPADVIANAEIIH